MSKIASRVAASFIARSKQAGRPVTWSEVEQILKKKEREETWEGDDGKDFKHFVYRKISKPGAKRAYRTYYWNDYTGADYVEVTDIWMDKDGIVYIGDENDIVWPNESWPDQIVDKRRLQSELDYHLSLVNP